MADELRSRKQIRLKEYDYSTNGCYFVTICVKNKRQLLSHYRSKDKIVGAGLCARPQDAVVKTPLGYKIEKSVNHISQKHKNISVDNYIIMPTHIHILLSIDNFQNGSAGGHGNPPLQKVIVELKSFTTKQYRDLTKNGNAVLWQRGFYDHIIRNRRDYEETWNYIEYNALKDYQTKDKVKI